MHLDLQNIKASFCGLCLLGGYSEVFENQQQKLSSPDFLSLDLIKPPQS